MRPYQPKDNVQKKAYYTDRFWVAPKVPRQSVESDALYAEQLARLKAACEVKESYIELGQLVVIVHFKEIRSVMKLLKEELGYEMLSEMSAMDYLAKCGGFELFYQLLNLKAAKRLRVKCFLPKENAIDTVEDMFKSANFAEREMFDMFGIYVNGHSYLKRIMMPDDWEGHPLLKTYPLQGDEAAQWYEVDKIFGKEYRDVIGPENRDPARIDRFDTLNFARVGHEVPFGEDITKGEPETGVRYQEGKRPLLIEKFNPERSKLLKERK